MLKFLLPLIVSCAAAFAADEFELRMERPMKVGDRMKVTGSRLTTHATEFKVGAQVVKDERSEIDVEYAHANSETQSRQLFRIREVAIC